MPNTCLRREMYDAFAACVLKQGGDGRTIGQLHRLVFESFVSLKPV
jgi:hypothetical protein